MSEDASLKSFAEIVEVVRSRFTTKKTLEKNLIKLKEMMMGPTPDTAQFFSSAVKVKCSLEERMKIDPHERDYVIAGRLLFKSILKDLKNGFKFTEDYVIDAIENYERSIKITTEKNLNYISGCNCFELADKLKQIFYYEEAYIRFTMAAGIFEDFADLKLTCLWQSICCLIYAGDFLRLKASLEEFLPISASYPTHFDAKLIYMLTDVILNPCQPTLDNHFKDLKMNDNELALYYHIKAICSTYIVGDLNYFLTVENLLLTRASREQYFIIVEMEHRINNKYEFDL